MTSVFKKKKYEFRIITDVDILLIIETGIRGGMCQSIHRYAKANKKHMNNFDKRTESSYLMYLDAKNLQIKEKPF